MPAPYLIHPLELPVNQVAAQAYTNAFPDQVSLEAWVNLPPTVLATKQAAGTAALAAGDPRLAGQGQAAGATVSSVAPTTAPHGTPTAITLTGTNLTSAKKVNIGKDASGVVASSATTVTAKTPGNVAAGVLQVKVSFADMSTLTGPSFTYS
jgi:IPT/TIG domain-containing protein